MARLRTRGHKVVLNRSAGGDTGITIILVILGAFMFLPMLYVIMQSLKPLDELWMFPPRFYVVNPTFDNFKDLFTLMNDSWVPFSRYIFNTVFISVVGTAGHLFFASLAAYAFAKIKFPGGKMMFKTIRTSLMFHATVTQLVNYIGHVQARLDRYLRRGDCPRLRLDSWPVPDEAVHGYQRFGGGPRVFQT